MIACICYSAHLMGEQRSPTTKVKIETVFARLDRLGLGEDSEDVADVQESIRRADLFT